MAMRFYSKSMKTFMFGTSVAAMALLSSSADLLELRQSRKSPGRQTST
jgi:hypothetical protein